MCPPGLLHEPQVHFCCICAFICLNLLNRAIGITLTSLSGESDGVRIRNSVCLAKVYHRPPLSSHELVTVPLRTRISLLCNEGNRSVDLGLSFLFHIIEWDILFDCISNECLYFNARTLQFLLLVCRYMPIFYISI